VTRMDARDQRQLETRTVGRLGFCSLGKGIGWLAVDGSVIGGAGAAVPPGYRAGSVSGRHLGLLYGAYGPVRERQTQAC
jgi:hypothetical protein